MPSQDLAPVSSLVAPKPSRPGILAALRDFFNLTPDKPPELIVDLSDRQVYLAQNETVIANYQVAIGQAGWETPVGQFSVINMQQDPVWQHPFTGEIVAPGATNPLGSRWIGFWTDGAHQIGLHGTNQEDLIGQAVSHGCIRLREADIQALFTQVTIGTPITVRP
ncbi:MAG: L,D-transpeptidase [Cyanobacteria bacterium CRU_2_1]|nr:L,D-transpeptidase [Cyanobacteria bacterium RU_5_0]NJR62145.1 L,D-transpeptidase [Cyanobacteria bacterium CRU_2_1]